MFPCAWENVYLCDLDEMFYKCPLVLFGLMHGSSPQFCWFFCLLDRSLPLWNSQRATFIWFFFCLTGHLFQSPSLLIGVFLVSNLGSRLSSFYTNSVFSFSHVTLNTHSVLTTSKYISPVWISPMTSTHAYSALFSISSFVFSHTFKT